MARQQAPKPWRRDAPGRYLSVDGRFAVEQSDPGRWFVTDEAEHDELGLPRTLGPFATLDLARAAADAARETLPEVSPLTERIARSREGEPRERPPRPTAAPKPAASPKPAAPKAAQAPKPPPKPAPPPSWLDRLEPAEASRARRIIHDLERLGLADAEETVRTDGSAPLPAVATALLARRIVRAAIEPWSEGEEGGSGQEADAIAESVRTLVGRAVAAGLSEAETRELYAAVARVAVTAALREVSDRDGDPDARRLPGWRLAEHDPERPERARRIHLSAGDLD